MRPAILFSLILAATGCLDPLSLDRTLPVALAVGASYSFGTPPPVMVQGGARSLVVRGAPGLVCGVSRAEGTANLSGQGNITISLHLYPWRWCSIAPVETPYEAIVTDIPPGAYDVTVIQSYFAYQDAEAQVLFAGPIAVGSGS